MGNQGYHHLVFYKLETLTVLTHWPYYNFESCLCESCFVLFCIFETGAHYVASADLELTMKTRLTKKLIEICLPLFPMHC